MARFFIAGTNFPNGRAIIRGRDADHIRVLRLRAGDDIVICDGAGHDYKCRLVRSDKDEAEAEIIEVTQCAAEPTVSVRVLCGLPKGDKTDYIIQKCVEAGAHEICFFRSERVVQRTEGITKKLERWNRISEEAAKQSGRGIIPEVRWLDTYVEALDAAKQQEAAFFMYETGEREGMRAALKGAEKLGSAAIITGPEGGFEPYEADMARKVGMHICAMGARILRCETAPVVALTALMYESGNLEAN